MIITVADVIEKYGLRNHELTLTTLNNGKPPKNWDKIGVSIITIDPNGDKPKAEITLNYYE